MADYLRSIEPESVYEENIFEEFLGQAHKRLTDDRAAGKIRYFEPAKGGSRFYRGSDVIAWLESFAVEPAKPEPVAVASEPVKAADASPKPTEKK